MRLSSSAPQTSDAHTRLRPPPPTHPPPHPPLAGVETIHPVGSMSKYEKDGLDAMKPELLASIEKVRGQPRQVPLCWQSKPASSFSACTGAFEFAFQFDRRPFGQPTALIPLLHALLRALCLAGYQVCGGEQLSSSIHLGRPNLGLYMAWGWTGCWQAVTARANRILLGLILCWLDACSVAKFESFVSCLISAFRTCFKVSALPARGPCSA